MHEAFVLESVGSTDKGAQHEDFLSACCTGNKLLVGTSSGALHVFTIENTQNNALRVFRVSGPMKQFARKAILKVKSFLDVSKINNSNKF